MKLNVSYYVSQILLAVFPFVSVVSQDIVHHCVHGQDDFNSNGWEVYEGNLKWAASADDLPELFRNGLRGQYEDVFYFDMSDPITANPAINYFFSPLPPEQTAYIYIKYYAHAPNFAEFTVFPIKEGDFNHYLEGATDFKWREKLIEIDPIGLVEIGATPGPVPENFFFIDTIIFVRGKELSQQEVKDLCPTDGSDPVTSTPTSDSTVETSDSTAVTSDSTVVTSDSTVVTSDSTVVTSDSTVVTSDSTVVTSDSTVVTSDSTIVTTDSTVVTSDSTLVTTDSTAVTSDSTAVTSESTVVTSDSTAVTSDSTLVTTDSTVVTSDPTVTISHSTNIVSDSTNVPSYSTETTDSTVETNSPRTETASSPESNPTPGVTSPFSVSTTAQIPITEDELGWYYIAMYSLLPLIALIALVGAIYYYHRSQTQKPHNTQTTLKPFKPSPSNLSLKSFDIAVDDFSNNNNNVVPSTEVMGSPMKNPLASSNGYMFSPEYSLTGHQHYESLQLPDDYNRRGSNISNRSTRSTYSGIKDPDGIIPRLIRN